VQKTGGPIFTIYMSYDVFLHKGLPVGSRDDCTCVKIFSGVIFCVCNYVLMTKMSLNLYNSIFLFLTTGRGIRVYMLESTGAFTDKCTTTFKVLHLNKIKGQLQQSYFNHHNRFTALFQDHPVSRCQKRTSGLYGAPTIL